MKKFEINIKASLKMPCGKIAAQAAHAMGMAFMAHCEVISNVDDSVVLKVHDNGYFTGKTFEQLVSAVSLNQVSDDVFDELKNAIESDSYNKTVVVDNGLTCFGGEKTPTIIMRDFAGGAVSKDQRLPFDVDAGITCKQGFFVKRSSGHLENDIIIECSVLSLLALTSRVDLDSMTLTLVKSSPVYSWLTTAFGKTVVGSKKESKFRMVVDTLVAKNVRTWANNAATIVVTEPLPSDELEQLTHTSTFRLL
ncbi:peptidyl-tRNA hydrolase [Photobacterium damselae]|uniref:peptidyl-tRNA hydrolase n=1 Tax=Photobacterium damselae TaxID=38293 RepID=UPI001F39DE8E|nr:peptidyl-tRNA hydrolase [Photobacterium damselae]UKA05013.1 peptidyl-tRNA hydrolase [Photobacterium damselae subsp. damselae]